MTTQRADYLRRAIPRLREECRPYFPPPPDIDEVMRSWATTVANTDWAAINRAIASAAWQIRR